MYHIKISAIEVYHGQKVVSNEYYYEHFKKRQKDIEHYLKDVMGRDKRYLINPDTENSLTMSLEATKKLLMNNNLKGSDIDMIVFSSQLPEYVAPPTSIYIHHEIDGKSDAICYDFNVNCAGMVTGIELISKYIQLTPKINKVLLIGCDYINLTINKENTSTYGNYGDAACTVLLERTNENTGLIDTKFHVNSIEYQNILYPNCGFSNIFKVKNEEDHLLKWDPFNGTDCAIDGINNIRKLLDENDLTKDDIGMFCFSQFSLKTIEVIRDALEIEESKNLYIGDEYGYTGTSSPFIVLYEALKRGLVKRGEYIIFWTIGAGSENVSMLFKL